MALAEWEWPYTVPPTLGVTTESSVGALIRRTVDAADDGGYRVRGAGHWRLLRQYRQRRHLPGRRCKEDRQAPPGRLPDLRARPDRAHGAQLRGRPAQVHPRQDRGLP